MNKMNIILSLTTTQNSNMKYSLEIEVNKPLEKVIALLDDPEKMKHWQPGLLSYEVLSDEPRKEGVQMKLRYKMGKREIEMIETITAYDLPKGMSATYETNGVINIQKNLFHAIDENRTHWVSDNEFVFNNFMMKLMGTFMPRAFKKQSKIYLQAFKKFAEKSQEL